MFVLLFICIIIPFIEGRECLNNYDGPTIFLNLEPAETKIVEMTCFGSETNGIWLYLNVNSNCNFSNHFLKSQYMYNSDIMKIIRVLRIKKVATHMYTYVYSIMNPYLYYEFRMKYFNETRIQQVKTKYTHSLICKLNIRRHRINYLVSKITQIIINFNTTHYNIATPL